jgi:hypothetical protein
MTGAIKEITEESIKLWLHDLLEKDKWGTYDTRKIVK